MFLLVNIAPFGALAEAFAAVAGIEVRVEPRRDPLAEAIKALARNFVEEVSLSLEIRREQRAGWRPMPAAAETSTLRPPRFPRVLKPP